jgi:hypothetical protein
LVTERQIAIVGLGKPEIKPVMARTVQVTHAHTDAAIDAPTQTPAAAAKTAAAAVSD